MAENPNSVPAPAFHSFIVAGKAGDFPASQAERLALYAAGALRSRPSRKAVEDLIEALIASLDALDGCPDLEDGGDDEPSLSGGSDDDREADDDLEPSLGSLERDEKSSQVGWAMSDSTDREQDGRSGRVRERVYPDALPTISLSECRRMLRR